MRAGLNHIAIFQYDNPVGVQHGGQAMRNRDDGSSAARPFKGFLDFVFRFASSAPVASSRSRIGGFSAACAQSRPAAFRRRTALALAHRQGFHICPAGT